MTKEVWTRLGMDPDDKSTWTAHTNMPSHNTFDAAHFAPRAWASICELCGGEVTPHTPPPQNKNRSTTRLVSSPLRLDDSSLHKQHVAQT